MTQTSRNSEKAQLTAVALQKTRGDSTISGTKIVDASYQVRSPKNV